MECAVLPSELPILGLLEFLLGACPHCRLLNRFDAEGRHPFERGLRPGAGSMR